MEGLAGQGVVWTGARWWPGEYQKGRRLLTSDVNAVIDGLFTGGADEVFVTDAHGSGSPEPDLLLDELDERAVMTFRDEPFRPYVDLTEQGAFDAVVAVGMHAKQGSRGFISHTYSIGTELILNGMSITETELIGYSWGRVGVPVIFASGDDRLLQDLETMPWLVFAKVKDSQSANEVTLRPLEEAREALRSGAEQAMRNRHEARVMTLSHPITAALRAVHPARLDVLDGVPGIDYQNQTVTFQAADFGEAYDGLIALIGVASVRYSDVTNEVLAGSPGGAELSLLQTNALYSRWLEVESGRWSPEPAPETEVSLRYHGTR